MEPLLVALLLALAAGPGLVLFAGGTTHPGPGCTLEGDPPTSCGFTSARDATMAAVGSAWINVTGSSSGTPSLDFWASLTRDPPDQELVMFGGCNGSQCPVPAQTWAFAQGSWSNITNESSQPPARDYASMDYDSADGYVLLFGGVGARAVLGDTWSFSQGTWTNRTASATISPQARWGASAAYDPVDHGVLLFGGMSKNGSLLNDTWLFSSGSWHNVTPAGSPPPRYEASLAWDVADSEAVLVEGCGSPDCPLADAWAFQNGAWFPLPTSSMSQPPPRFLAAMSYAAADGNLVLFGGIDHGVSLGDMWIYSSGTWTRESPLVAPRAREGSAILESSEAWSSQGDPMVSPFVALWGGDWVPCSGCGLEPLADTWVYEAPPSVTISTPDVAPLTGTRTTFHAAVSGGTPPFGYNWSLGDGARDSGANASHSYSAPGTYPVEVSIIDGAGVHATATLTITVGSPALRIGLLEWGIIGIAAAATVSIVALRFRRGRRPPATGPGGRSRGA